MKKLFAMLLAIAILAFPLVSGAEDAVSSRRNTLVLSDLVISSSVNGEENELSLEGLRFALEDITQGDTSALLASLLTPEDVQVLGLEALLEGNQLLISIDGISKVLAFDLDEVSSLVAQEMENSLSGGMNLAEPFSQEELEEIAALVTAEEIEGTVEKEFLYGEVLPATGMRIVFPEAFYEKLFGLFGTMMTAEVEEIGDISAECVLWTSEDGNDARCELEVSVEDETVGVTCLAQQQEDSSVVFAVRDEDSGEVMFDGYVEVLEHSFYAEMNALDAQGNMTGYLAIAGEESQVEGSDTYGEQTFGMSIGNGSNEVYLGVTALDTGEEQSFSLSLAIDENTIAFGYDGTTETNEDGESVISGVVYVYYSDTVGNDILATFNVDSVLNTDGGVLPDFSGKEVITQEELMQMLEEDEELMNEFEAAYFNAMTALLEIPAVSETMFDETSSSVE